jgi:CRP/FNR family transcriptional regulator, cyclic AMP receptor protein
MSEGEVVTELRPCGILSFLDEQSLEALKYHGVFGEYGPGEVIIREGESQHFLFVVISGRLEVLMVHGGKEVLLGEIEEGDCLGEVSIFEPGEASATVRVVETAVLWSLEVDQLQDFFEKLPVAGGQLLLGITQLMARRLRHANQQILANRITPKHLSCRSARMEPIKAGSLHDDKKGIISGLFGSKHKPTIPTQIKR